MKMSTVSFNIWRREQSPNIDGELNVIGQESIDAVTHAVKHHDDLVEALEYLLSAISADPAPDGHDYVCAAEHRAVALLTKIKEAS